jgi:hypothetical protein
MIMSNPSICRDCEYNSVDDAVLCHDCAEDGFIEIMRSNAAKRWDVFIGEHYCANAAEMDAHSSAIFEAWVERNPEKAGKIIFAFFEAQLQDYRHEGEM